MWVTDTRKRMETKEQCHVFHIFSDLKALFGYLYVGPLPQRSRQAWGSAWAPPRAASRSFKGKGRETSHHAATGGRKQLGKVTTQSLHLRHCACRSPRVASELLKGSQGQRPVQTCFGVPGGAGAWTAHPEAGGLESRG